MCIKDYSFAEESECNIKEKPTTFEQCLPEELTECKPKWHFSEWTEVCCSKNLSFVSWFNLKYFLITLT